VPVKPTKVGVPTAAGLVARLAFRQAKAAGIALPPLLKTAHLTLSQMRDRDQAIGVRAQIEFLNLVASAVGDDLLGFHLAQTAELREVGLFYYVLASSDTLADVLRRGARYSSIISDGVAQKLIDGREIGISMRYVGVSRHLDRHQIEFWVTTMLRMCRELTGVRLVPEHVSLVHTRSAGQAEFASFFECEVEFGASVDAITFPSALARLPVVKADPYLNRLLMRYCKEIAEQRSGSLASFRAGVENAIGVLLPHGRAKAGEVANRLGLSVRTFARRLEHEGLTFSRVLSGLRHDLARRHLADTGLSISQIAWLLGYQEVATFSRAFKRWAGQAPSAAATRLRPARE
jgi:AraC-like DNA-binding protein